MRIDTKLFKLIIFLISIKISCSQFFQNKNDLNILLNNYYSSSSEEITENKFITGNINNNSSNYYIFHIKKDSEQVFFDFQSEFGCLNISIDEEISTNISNHFQFCSEGKNNIFSLNKKEILDIVVNNKTESDSIANINITIEVGPSYLESELNLNFDYSLKISLRKPNINIFEINTEHKILCKTGKVEEEKYRCIFMIVNNNNEQNDNNIILYSISQNNIKLNIYADYINKEYYDNWYFEYLYKNIPNINSAYNNNNNETDFIIIPNLDKNKYIYISIESNFESTIELTPNILKNNDDSKLPKINDIQIYSINNNINFNFNNLQINEISLSIVTLYGKGNIYLEYDRTTEYITDIRENKILLNINLESCKVNNNCKLIINQLEKKEDYIFYIYYEKKSNNILKELSYGKSNKLLYNINQNPIILYESIPNIDIPININLQLYNISDSFSASNFNIQLRILSKEDIYQVKLDYNNINKYENKIEKNFDSILSSFNIYLTPEKMKSFNINEDPWLIIYISSENILENLEKIILGSTISGVNSLIYPSERIYHFGQFNNEEKIVYKLKGNSNYHLMRLEFGCNSDYIDWSVKRTMDNDNYMNNDTDLSFVTEKWMNGRQLLTMYIENGEDIYLTVFIKKKLVNKKLSNHIFKYINSEKNGDFKNYLVKQDSLNYDNKNNRITINKITNIPSSSKIIYYLKIIKEEDYIENESLNTIAITESNSNISVKGENLYDNIVFNIKDLISKDITYYINAYSIINENNDDIEFISYSGLKIIELSKKKRESNNNLVISSISIGGAALLFLFIRLICYYRRKRRFHHLADIIERYNYDDDILLT